MQEANLFFIAFFITILITRVWLYFKPTPSPTIKGFRLHHWMTGLLIILISLPFNSLIGFAIGLGLFVDELTYLLIKGKDHADNYSKTSLIGTALFVLVVFIFREQIIYLIQ